MWPAKLYKRWRHARGFGIHSPFAYAMVRQTLRNPRGCGYYAYASLPSREMRLIFRILIALRPVTVAISAPTDAERDAVARVVGMALPDARIAAGEASPDMLICLGSAPVGRLSPRHAYFGSSRHPAIPSLTAGRTTGHVYRNPRRTLIVDAPHVPFQTFDLIF